MCSDLSRRCFLKTATVGVMASSSLLALAQHNRDSRGALDLGFKTKIRVGKVYLGHQHPGWPRSTVDLNAEMKRFEAELSRLTGLADVEFVDGGLVSNAEHVAQAVKKMKGVSGILAIHLTLGTGPQMEGLMESGLPLMIYSQPFSGHEWHIVASWQRQGRLVEVLPSSRYEDLAEAIRPFRAQQRLRETRVLHISQHEADPAYVRAIKEKYGTEIRSLYLADLEAAYRQADQAEAEADARRWIREARKMIEPKPADVLKGSLMYVAMRNLLAQHEAQAITVNCLGMGLIDRGMGYPCLGFVRLNNRLLTGVCEADLKSTLTQLIFSYLVGRTGFVTDPAFDLSNNTINHAHCVAATQMEGPNSKCSPYFIRTHLEDNKGVSLQVVLPVGRKISMARLIGTDKMLFSTGDAVGSPLIERGCRSKLAVRVDHIDKFLADWSCGLHRVVFYGDHTRDLNRFCRFAGIQILREGIDDLQKVPGLEWESHVHA